MCMFLLWPTRIGWEWSRIAVVQVPVVNGDSCVLRDASSTRREAVAETELL